jgi:protein ImuB
MLWAGLHLPRLALEVFTRAACSAGPFAVCDGSGLARQVIDANAEAQRLGVSAGMRASAALALSGTLCLRAREARAEAAALAALAAWAGQFTPLVHLAAPQALLLEVGASLRLFRGLPALLADIARGIAGLGYTARLGVAPTPLAATWLARAAVETPVTDGSRLPGALAPLPLAVLDLAAGAREGLEGMGVRSLGELLRLPRAGLSKRFGTELVAMLDRALGRLPDPRTPYVPPATHESRLLLPAAVGSLEAILFALNRLLLELGGVLTARVAGVQELALGLVRASGAATEIRLGLLAPTRDPHRLAVLFRERLARVALKAPVEALVLRAPCLVPLASIDFDLFGSRSGTGEQGRELIERLRARLGRRAVRGLKAVAEHRPEYALACAEPGETGALVVSGARPLWLLEHPVAIEVHEGRPWLDGALELESSAERIESGWWDGRGVARDYYTARRRGGECYWVFRDLAGGGRWWLHGIFG